MSLRFLKYELYFYDVEIYCEILMFIFFFYDGKDYVFIFVGKVIKCIDWSKIKLLFYIEIVLWYIFNSREIFIIEYDKYFNFFYCV